MELLEQAWSGILDLSELFVIPDWGALIALLPVFMAVVLIAFLISSLLRYRSIGPRRRRPGRVKPVTPAGIHMPGPTWAPVLAAIGAFLLFMGLVFNGILLALGLVALVLSLLYWGREGLTDYDAVAGEPNRLPAVIHPGPPPGVHMPGPSFEPILASLGVFVLFAGLVFGGWVLAVGVIITVVSLLSWLNAARKDYRQVARADVTGHLENDPPPGWPKTLLTVFSVLVVAAVALNAGWFPPRSATGTEGDAGGSPAPSGGTPGGSGGPGAPGDPGTVAIVAEGVKFTTATLSAPADKAFKLALDNKDAGIPHDVDFLDEAGTRVYDMKEFNGPRSETFDVPPLKAGTYRFECSIHAASMNGQLTVGG